MPEQVLERIEWLGVRCQGCSAPFTLVMPAGETTVEAACTVCGTSHTPDRLPADPKHPLQLRVRQVRGATVGRSDGRAVRNEPVPQQPAPGGTRADQVRPVRAAKDPYA